ncbi:MAG: glycosyltransferase family 4 protein [Anaerolineales bacterium]
MKILAVHNYYQLPGGEDTAYRAEVDLLRRNGHEVRTYERSNSEIRQLSPLQKAALPVRVTWSIEDYSRLRRLLQAERPDLVHFHNTHMMISPSAYYACKSEGIPVIQSLDNPRLLCPAATFFREGRLCEDCLGKTPPWPGVLHACYRGSRLQTAAVAVMLTTHRLLKTWEKQVDEFLVATKFYREKFIEGGLPANKILVKPHFVHPDPLPRADRKGDYALFIGRLEPVKGIDTLLNAWKVLPGVPLKVRGSGPLLQSVQAAAAENAGIRVIEQLPPDQLTELIKGARFLIWPSEGNYETFGFVAAEAFACGVPVIASNAGVQSEMVEDGETGLLFVQGNADDLAAKVSWAWGHTDEMAAMGRWARTEYERKYSAARAYGLLLDVYTNVIDNAMVKSS